MCLRAHHRLDALTGYTLGALGFVVVGILLLVIKQENAISVLVGCASVIFFGACGIVSFGRLLDRREILIIDREGILDRRVLDRAIPWTSVENIQEVTMRHHVFFYVTLSEPVHRFVDTRYKRLLLAINKRFGGDVYLSDHGLTVGTDQLRAALLEAWQSARQKERPRETRGLS